MKININNGLERTMQEQPSNSRTQEWLMSLKSSGYRLTAPRRSVVEILADSRHALNATQIFDRARQYHATIGLVSVYRTLDKLEQLDLIQRVHQPGGCQAFIAAFSGHQHLLLCRECSRFDFFEGDQLDTLFDNVEIDSGYEIHEHWLQLFGICAECRSVRAE